MGFFVCKDDDGEKSHNITYGMLESHLETQVPVSPVRSSASPKIIRISLFAGAGLGLWNDGNLGDFNLSGILHPNGVGYMLTGGARLRVWRLLVGVRINKPNVVKKMFPSIHIGYQSKSAAGAFVPPALIYMFVRFIILPNALDFSNGGFGP